MSDGFCLLYCRPARDPFCMTELEVTMARCGVSLRIAGSNDISALTLEGEQERWDWETFRNALNTLPSLSFQWWQSEDEDVYCRLRRAGDIHVVELGLDGLDDGQVARLCDSLLRFAEEAVTRNEFVGLIIDVLGLTADYDWDESIIAERQLSHQLPDMIALTVEKANAISKGGVEFEYWKSLALLRKR